METWRATGTLGEVAFDPRATSPIAIVPVRPVGDRLLGVASPGYQRLGRGWWFTLTGIAPDGLRYRLSDGDGWWRYDDPSLLEWLQAPD